MQTCRKDENSHMQFSSANGPNQNYSGRFSQTKPTLTTMPKGPFGSQCREQKGTKAAGAKIISSPKGRSPVPNASPLQVFLLEVGTLNFGVIMGLMVYIYNDFGFDVGVGVQWNQTLGGLCMSCYSFQSHQRCFSLNQFSVYI